MRKRLPLSAASTVGRHAGDMCIFDMRFSIFDLRDRPHGGLLQQPEVFPFRRVGGNEVLLLVEFIVCMI
jgi:hypothetical protein